MSRSDEYILCGKKINCPSKEEGKFNRKQKYLMYTKMILQIDFQSPWLKKSTYSRNVITTHLSLMHVIMLSWIPQIPVTSFRKSTF